MKAWEKINQFMTYLGVEYIQIIVINCMRRMLMGRILSGFCPKFSLSTSPSFSDHLSCFWYSVERSMITNLAMLFKFASFRTS